MAFKDHVKSMVLFSVFFGGEKENATVEDIIVLHAEFEYIHPFQNGNGREEGRAEA